MDVRQGLSSLRSIGLTVNLLRQPYVTINLPSRQALYGANTDLASCTVVSVDTYARFPDAESVVDTVRRAGGGVVLMHDFDGGGEHTEYVLTLTHRLIEAARESGWRLCRQSEVMNP